MTYSNQWNILDQTKDVPLFGFLFLQVSNIDQMKTLIQRLLKEM